MERGTSDADAIRAEVERLARAVPAAADLEWRPGSRPGRGDAGEGLAGMIDHTLLKAESTREDVERVCDEAIDNAFWSVCVNSHWVPLVSGRLAGAPVRTCSVVGFPLGAMATQAKEFETRWAVAAGADEIDMVINIGELKSGGFQSVLDDIADVVEASGRALVKVILEMASLTREEKVAGCLLSKLAGAAFVKTSTGFGGGGATPGDVALMRAVVGDDMQVKASGGVHTRDEAAAVIAAGADRIGASGSVALISGGEASGY